MCLSTAGSFDPGGRISAAVDLLVAFAALSASEPVRIPGERPGWNGKRRRRRRRDNFEETPVVVRQPYQYHLEKAQNEP